MELRGGRRAEKYSLHLRAKICPLFTITEKYIISIEFCLRLMLDPKVKVHSVTFFLNFVMKLSAEIPAFPPVTA